MSLKTSIFCLLTLILLVSCDKKRVFDEYHSVGKSWNKDTIVCFDLPKVDTQKTYNLYLNLRDNNDYPYNNIFLIVSLQQPNKKTMVDTLEYQMADPEGNLLGDGFTDVKESKLIYKEGFRFMPGPYKVSIKQAVRQTGKVAGVVQLDGITEIGFRIEKTN
jgi:gliding motility-associated lipoprotein GldH